MTASAPLKIDLHTHILPPPGAWPNLREKFGYGGWVRLEPQTNCCARMMIDDRHFRDIESNCWDPSRRITECDACGVSMQVLSTVPVMFSYWAKPADAHDLAKLLNDHLAGVVADFPNRFIGLGTIPMQSPALAIKELERCVKELQFPGVQIGSHVNGQNLDDPAIFEVFQAAAELGAAVFVHPWDVLGKERMGKYWLPWLVGMPAETALAICSVIFGGVLERLPTLRIGFAHGGGAFPFTVGRIEHGFAQRPDLCAVDNNVSPRNYLGRFYLDSLVHDADALRYLIKLVGAERIAMGSDYPFPLGEGCPGGLIESMTDLSAATKSRLLAGTALEFLGSKAERRAQATEQHADPGDGGVTVAAHRTDEAFALQLDRDDPLRHFRERFHIPTDAAGEEMIYFAGNSLGLQPKSARALVEQELDDWARLAVEGHFEGRTPWYSYHEIFRELVARLVGALPQAREVVMMNSLTINLHLMMVSFFQPTPHRFKILIEEPAFPSDIYAVKTHLRTRGFDPGEALVIIKPRAREQTIRTQDVEGLLDEQGDEIALTLFSGVNFFTGQVFDIERITAAAKSSGCIVGWDLAHAAGNVPLSLHDWDVDFACWCSYKYLNSGPGAVAGCFVHERHGDRPELQRLGGWWGNDPATRFKMHLIPEFHPQLGAEGWQVSNPPILAMAPLRASLEIFDEATMPALREKSIRLTGYLRFLIDQISARRFEIITPVDPAQQGCQLSMLVHEKPREHFTALQACGVVCDFREPNVIRVAPTPLYNTFHDAWRFAQAFASV